MDLPGGEVNEVQPPPDKGKGDLYNPNECWRCGGMGHFARECTQDINPTKAIGKLHHTLEAETPIAKSLLTEFFNKLMRVQRKHDIVQAKLKKSKTDWARRSPGRAPRTYARRREIAQETLPPHPLSPSGQAANRKGGGYNPRGQYTSRTRTRRVSKGGHPKRREMRQLPLRRPEKTR